MKKQIKTLGLILLSLTLFACQSSLPTETTVPTTTLLNKTTFVEKNSAEFSVMTFNVENLFDTKHDKGTEDFPNLPLYYKKNSKEAQKFCSEVKKEYYRKECFEKDWNEKKLNQKLKNLSDVIHFVDSGKGPDNILLSEVENLRVLKQLNSKYLKDLGYKTVVLIEGPDLRGIDPGFLSKFPMIGKPTLHLVPYTDSDPEQLKWARRSRGILEVTVKAPNKKNITFLSAHFPSQANPTEWRAQAVQFAKNLMLQYQKEGRSVIFGGDLNIITSEETQKGYFKNELSAAGAVSHLVGCKHCEGSHNYRGDWSFLDVIVFGNGLAQNGFELITSSITTLKTPFNVKENGTPKSFNENTGEGVADHLPMYARIKMVDSSK